MCAENGTHRISVWREVDECHWYHCLVGVFFFLGGVFCLLAVVAALSCVCVHVYCFIGVTEQMSFLNECNYVINN